MAVTKHTHLKKEYITMRKLILASVLALAMPAMALANSGNDNTPTTTPAFSGVGFAGTGSFGGSFSTSQGDGVAQGFSSSTTAATGGFTGTTFTGTTATSFTSGEESTGSAGGFSGAFGGGLSVGTFGDNASFPSFPGFSN